MSTKGKVYVALSSLALALIATAPSLFGQVVYVTELASKSVSAYTIDSTTGALTPIAGSPFATGASFSVAVDPTGRFAYLLNAGSDSVSAYTINSTTGALTLIAGSPFPAGFDAVSVAVDPRSRFVYVANFSGSVSAYTINSITGALTPIAGSPFPAGFEPVSVAVDPRGRFVYVASEFGKNEAPGDVSAYTIDSITGALTPIAGSPFPAGSAPISVAVDPGGRFVYVANQSSQDVSGYTIDSTTGALTAIFGSPFSGGRLPQLPQSVAVDPTGKFAYVANFSGSGGVSSVSAYTINSTTGALTAIAGSPFAGGLVPLAPKSVAVDPTGRFVYVPSQQGSSEQPAGVVGFTINSTTGALTPIAGSPFPITGIAPISIALRSCPLPTQVNPPTHLSIQNLRGQVDALVEGAVLNRGQGNSLNVKLNAAREHFDAQNLVAAGNEMGAFMDETHALVASTVLTVEQAQPLFAGGRLVIRLFCRPVPVRFFEPGF